MALSDNELVALELTKAVISNSTVIPGRGDVLVLGEAYVGVYRHILSELEKSNI